MGARVIDLSTVPMSFSTVFSTMPMNGEMTGEMNGETERSRAGLQAEAPLVTPVATPPTEVLEGTPVRQQAPDDIAMRVYLMHTRRPREALESVNERIAAALRDVLLNR